MDKPFERTSSACHAEGSQVPQPGLGGVHAAAENGGAAGVTPVTPAGAPTVWVPPPFEPGHDLSTKHGGYRVVALKDRAAQIADDLQVQAGNEADRASVEICALTLARIESADAAIEVAEPAQRAGLEHHLRSWLRLASEQLRELGLTPAGRARIAKDSGVAFGATAFGISAIDESSVAGAHARLVAKLQGVVERMKSDEREVL